MLNQHSKLYRFFSKFLRKVAAGFLVVILIFIGQPAFSVGADSLSLSTQPSSTQVDGIALATQPVVTITNNGSAVSGVVVTAAIGVGTGTLTNTTATSNSSGIATFSGLAITGTTGVFTLVFSENGSTVTSSNITVSVGSVSKLAISNTPSTSAVNGVALATQPIISAQDVGGNTNTTAAGSITATMNNHSASNPSANLSSGVATFSGLAFVGIAGSFALTFSYNGITVQQQNFILQVGAGTQLFLATSPIAQAASGAALSVQPILNVQDSGGNLVTDATGTVTATISTGTATLSGATATITNGVATFTNLTIIGLPGSVALTFTSGSLTSVSSASITLGAGAAANLLIATQPSLTTTNGAALSGQPVIRITDSNGNVVTSATGNVTAVVQSGTGTLTNSSATIADGIATFSGLTISGKVGNFTISFSYGSAAPVTSQSIALSAGSATKLGIITSPSIANSSNTAFSTQPVIAAQDSSGNTVSSASGTITASIASGSANNGIATANLYNTTSYLSNGIATFSGMYASTTSGANITITFSSSSYTNVTSDSIVIAGSASQLLIVNQPSAVGTIGHVLDAQPKIKVADANGNLVTNAMGTVTAIVGSYNNATLSGSTISISGGYATFTSLQLSGSPGTYTLQFQFNGINSSQSSQITLAGEPYRLDIKTSPSLTAVNGVPLPQQPVIRVVDSGGRLVTAAIGVVNVLVNSVPIGSSAMFFGGVATFSNLAIQGPVGNVAVSFQSQGLIDAPITTVSLSIGQATKVVLTSQPSTVTTSGISLLKQPSVSIQDIGGNIVTSSSGTVNVAIASGSGTLQNASAIIQNGVATFSGLIITGAPGSVTLSFSYQSLKSGTSGAILIAGPPTKLVIDTAPSSTATSGVPFSDQPVIWLVDAMGNLASTAQGTVTANLISTAGSIENETATVVNGIATFTDLTIIGASGAFTISFTSEGLIPVNYTSIATQLPSPLSVSFSGASSSLSNAQKTQIKNLTKKLNRGGLVTITGYAKGNRALALKRAQAVGTYMRAQKTLGISYNVVTSSNASKAVAQVIRLQ